jgi:hypothetical protein
MILNLVVAVVSAVVAAAAGPLLGQIVGLAGGLVYLYGAWLLTEPDPSGTGEDQYGTVRKIIRVTLVIGLAQSVLALLTQRTIAAPPAAVALGVASVAVGLVGVVGQFATLYYLRRLAERIPDPAHAARAYLLFWGYGVTRAVMVVLGGASTIMGLFISRAAATTMPGAGGLIGVFIGLGCLSFAASIGVLVFGIMFLVLLYRLQMEFDRQAEYAKVVWAGVGAGPPPGA